jgi:hypothetical protein
VKGQDIVVTFDVDEKGNVLSVSFNTTRDRTYDRKLREKLESYRFRPAVRSDTGAPVRAKIDIIVSL